MNQPEVKTRSDKSVQQEFRIAECELRNWGHAELALTKSNLTFFGRWVELGCNSMDKATVS
jgi:hypothetical protein